MSFRLRIRRLRYPLTSLTGFVQSLLPRPVRSSATVGGPSQASLETSPCEHFQEVTINTLPDDVLVETFYFHVNSRPIQINAWHTLVHVCQGWRSIVFASPRYLNLRLEYRGKRPMSEMLDVWPVLPVVIRRGFGLPNSWANVAGALESEHHHCICQIDLPRIPIAHWERFAAAIQKPFPELTSLVIWTEIKSPVTSFPEPFLGGSAPLLRELRLENCPFLGIPKLLLSASQLVVLDLWDIPDSGYISPQDLGTALSVVSRLETLLLKFRSPLYPASRPPPPLTRSVLPVLTRLEFKGVHEYLEDLVAQIEAPLLNKLEVTFFMDNDFVIPQLHRLISHALSFKECDRAEVRTSELAIQFAIFRGATWFLSLEIRCRELDGQLSSLARCSSSFPLLPTLVQLDILDGFSQPHWDDMVTTQWLDLLGPFTAVKHLRLSRRVAPHVCRALEELADERVTGVLPSLNNIFLSNLPASESVPTYIKGFVATRKLSGHPVAVHRWEWGQVL